MDKHALLTKDGVKDIQESTSTPTKIPTVQTVELATSSVDFGEYDPFLTLRGSADVPFKAAATD